MTTLFHEDAPKVAPIVLRDYQVKAVQAINAARDIGKQRVLIVLPTGSGKTSVFCDLVRQEVGQSLILAHRIELLEQARNRVRLQCPSKSVGIEGGEFRCDTRKDVIVGGVATLGRKDCNRIPWLKPSLLVIDEAHHAPAATYQTVMDNYGAYNGKCFTVGVTATPHRMDNRPLSGDHSKAIFQELVYQYTLKEAISDHWLCDLAGYRVGTKIDLSQIKTVAGDYNQGQLEKAVNTLDRNAIAFDAWYQAANNRKTIVFCVGVEHSKEVASMFQAHGITCEHVDGAMDKEPREDIINRFRSGETQVLCNVQIATEGFDVEDIGCVLMLRPTQSWSLYCQMIGRGTRVSAGKDNCIVIDVVDNADKHSLATLPSMLGLPPQLDLNGKSVKDAYEHFDKLSDFQKGKLFSRECDYDSLFSTLTAIDLLGELTIPELEARTSFAWLKLRDGMYHLSAGSDKDIDGNRIPKSVMIEQHTLGNWTAKYLIGKTIADTKDYSDEVPIDMVFQDVELNTKRIWPHIGALADANADWRKNEPSDKQKALMSKLKIDPELIATATRGQASMLITQAMEGR